MPPPTTPPPYSAVLWVGLGGELGYVTISNITYERGGVTSEHRWVYIPGYGDAARYASSIISFGILLGI